MGKNDKDDFSLRDVLQIPPDPGDARAHLQEIHPAATPLAPGKKSHTKKQMKKYGPELTDLQEKLYAQAQADDVDRVLIVLQGMDTSGKGGIVEHVFGLINPAGLLLRSFKAPTKEELAHDFLWRVTKALPEPGTIGIFDRSQYEDVLIVRVHDLIPEAEWTARYEAINGFEADLAASGCRIIKCFLNVSFSMQRERLIARLDDPNKHWKFNFGDIKERGYWADYQVAYLDALTKCNSDGAPWYSIPADHKWYRNWAISRLLLETMRDINPQYPQMDFDVPDLKGQLAAPN
ncbi:MAG: PPK2 family polyphosphate kinase [Antricoccus sp.]